MTPESQPTLIPRPRTPLDYELAYRKVMASLEELRAEAGVGTYWWQQITAAMGAGA